MMHPALPKHLTLTGRPLLLMPSVLNELHTRLQNSYTPQTAKLADRIFRRAKAQTPEPSADMPDRILATRIPYAGPQAAPAIAQPDPYFAHITIEGPLLNKAAMFGETVCVDGYDRIEADIAAAIHDPDCAGILLDIDSPGGMVNGCFELSDKIGDWAKDIPIVAYTGGLLCSAAYAIASQCTEIHGALSATIGSIGVIYGRYDFTGAMDEAGIKVDYITSGAQKSWGHPETAMSEAELSTLQAEINQLADMFFGRVAAGRDMSAEDVKALEAGAFLTQTALTHGLVNSQTDITGALTRLSELAAQSPEPTSEPDPIPAPAPEPAAVSKKTAAKQSTPKQETPMSKSTARHRASLAVMLSGTASIMALKLATDADEDELKKAVDEETEEELKAMDDEDITSMDEDDDVEAMDEDEDIEAMDEDELEAMDEDADPEAEEEDEKPEASVAFKASASRIAHRAVATLASKPAAKPAKTGNAVKDAVAADRARSAAINALPEAKGRESMAAKLAAKGLSVEDAKDILATSPKATKRAFNPPSPRLGAKPKNASKTTAGDDLIAAASAMAAK